MIDLVFTLAIVTLIALYLRLRQQVAELQGRPAEREGQEVAEHFAALREPPPLWPDRNAEK